MQLPCDYGEELNLQQFAKPQTALSPLVYKRSVIERWVRGRNVAFIGAFGIIGCRHQFNGD